MPFSPRWPTVAPDAAIATSSCEPNSVFEERRDCGKALSMQGALAEFRPLQAWGLQQGGAPGALLAARRHAECLQSTCLYIQTSGTCSATTRHLFAVARPVFPKFFAELMLHHKRCNTSWLWTFDSESLLFLAILTLK